MHLDDAIGPPRGHAARLQSPRAGMRDRGGRLCPDDRRTGRGLRNDRPGRDQHHTGVLGQWHDSIPAIYISGQVRRDTTVASTSLPLRQLGDQEADIVRLVAPITKYAVCVVDPGTIRYHFEKATWLATHGRPGPVWLDIPLNVQAAAGRSGITSPASTQMSSGSRTVNAGSAGARDKSRGPCRSFARSKSGSALCPGRTCSLPRGTRGLLGAFDRDRAVEMARETVRRLAVGGAPGHPGRQRTPSWRHV